MDIGKELRVIVVEEEEVLTEPILVEQERPSVDANQE